MVRLISSILTSVKEFPSISSKRVKTPPQAGGVDGSGGTDVPGSAGPALRGVGGGAYWTRLNRGANPKRTPRLRHSRYVEGTSSVTSTTCVARPISLYSDESRFG